MNAPLPQRMVRFYRLAKSTAVMVSSVEPGSPAQRAIQPQDIIVAYGKHPVGGIDDLHRLLSEEQVGTAAELTIIRGTERLTIAVSPTRGQTWAGKQPIG